MSYPNQILYATVADLQEVMDGTDAGSGTASQLTQAQLTMALFDASSEISVFAGNIFDSSLPEWNPPPVFHSLTLALAAYYATITYLKHKELPATHPVYLRYQRAQAILADARDGKIQLDVGTAGGPGEDVGVIINRIPPIFSGEDSNTRIDPATGFLQSDVPFFDFSPGRGGLGDEAVYQG